MFQIRLLDKQNKPELEKVLTIQKLAYQVEADLIRASYFPPLLEKLEDLESTRDEIVVATLGSEIVGALFFEQDSGIILISKLIVAPKYFRKGIGQQLLQYILNRFLDLEFHVSTGALNTPALELYKKFGFEADPQTLMRAGIAITRLRKLPKKSHT